MRNVKRKTIILLSGGIDSTACLDFYKSKRHNVEALLINYGQISFKNELKAVRKICKHFSVPFHVITAKTTLKHKSGFVMGRNMFLLATALTHGGLESGFIGIGIHSGTNYVDCSELFAAEIGKLFELYTNGKIHVGAPFINWTKREIWEYCKKRKLPINLTYSCELGLKQPCGKCLSCKDLITLYAS